MAKIFLAALIGALLCVGWGGVSWMVLQWHHSTVHKFGDEPAIAALIKADAGSVLKLRNEESGVFMIPSVSSQTGRATEDGKQRERSALKAREDGPFVYAVVRPGAKPMHMGASFGFAAARSFGACFVLALLLSWTMHLDYIQRVFFCALAGVFAGVVADVPMLIWFETPLRHTLINLADHLCEWFLAGLAIAAFIPGREVWERFR